MTDTTARRTARTPATAPATHTNPPVPVLAPTTPRIGVSHR